MTDAQRRLAVLGSPIDHSRSPLIHRAAYAALGLDWSYEAIEVTESAFMGLFSTLDDSWLGFSVTAPLKRCAFDFARPADQASAHTGVVNTLVRERNGWGGYNTDIPGIQATVDQLGLGSITSALVLGSGATAMSTVYALTMMGCTNFTVCARREQQVNELREGLSLSLTPAGIASPQITFQHLNGLKSRPDVSNRPRVDLVVNTLPAEIIEQVEFEPEVMATSALFDIVYGSAPNSLTRRWETAGGRAVNGLELLVQQGVRQIRVFRGLPLDVPFEGEDAIVEVMRHASMGE